MLSNKDMIVFLIIIDAWPKSQDRFLRDKSTKAQTLFFLFWIQSASRIFAWIW